MEKPASERIVQSAEQPTKDLHEGVKESLRKLGHSGPTIPAAQTLPPLTEELKRVGVDAAHIAGSTFEEVVTGGATHIRETPSKKPLALVWERLRRLGRKVEPQSKKAA